MIINLENKSKLDEIMKKIQIDLKDEVKRVCNYKDVERFKCHNVMTEI